MRVFFKSIYNLYTLHMPICTHTMSDTPRDLAGTLIKAIELIQVSLSFFSEM